MPSPYLTLKPRTLRQATRQVAYAAGCDAGNRSMNRAGRTTWSEDDWNAAADVFDKLCPEG